MPGGAAKPWGGALSYATFVTYVPVLVAEQYQFPCRVFFDGFLAEDEQTGSNWFLLFLLKAKPPNKNKNLYHGHQDFGMKIFTMQKDRHR